MIVRFFSNFAQSGSRHAGRGLVISEGMVKAVCQAALLGAGFALAVGIHEDVFSSIGKATFIGRAAEARPVVAALLLPLMIAKGAVWGAMGLHHGRWRHTGFRELMRLVVGTILTLPFLWVMAVVLHLCLPQFGFDASVGLFVWDAILGLGMVGGVRVVARLLHEEWRPIAQGGLSRLLIVGSGEAAEGVLRELRRMPEQKYVVAGVVDEGQGRRRGRVQGVKILGGIGDLSRLCVEQQVDEILVALPQASKDEMQRILAACRAAQSGDGTGRASGNAALRFRTVPSMADLIAGNVGAGVGGAAAIRDVGVNDVLGRDAIQMDMGAVAAMLRGEVVLVSGAGGSIGSEMCRKICGFEPSLVVLVDKAENAVFEIERELRRTFPTLKFAPALGDISDPVRMEQIFGTFTPSVVFHAAAHKHVPLAESNPGEAIRNNMFGTKTLADAAAASGVKNFVMISTDKAVNPSSIMGATKRCAEMYIQSLARRSRTNFITVRFGNVLGSNGSVVPIFKQQIAAGGPVTVTHPEMRRYFMTIPEAAELVLQAGALGQRGEIFVLDMGQPVRILDLARDLIMLSGLRPDIDIPIVFTGLRPGEKLYEELSIRGEDMVATRHPKIAVWKSEARTTAQIQKMVDELEPLQHCTVRERVLFSLMEFIPEMKPWESGEKAEAKAPVAEKTPSEG